MSSPDNEYLINIMTISLILTYTKELRGEQKCKPREARGVIKGKKNINWSEK